MDKYPNITKLLDALINEAISADAVLDMIRGIDDLPMEKKEKRVSEIVVMVEAELLE